jgi:hypothetical protein
MSEHENYGAAKSRDYGARESDPADEIMSLRDYFAAQALIGMLAAKGIYYDGVAVVNAYRYADAMLAERERKTNAD